MEEDAALQIAAVTVDRNPNPRDSSLKQLDRNWFWRTLPLIGRLFGGYTTEVTRTRNQSD